MRLLTIGLLSAGLGIGACNRADTAENGNRPPQPVPFADAGRATSSESGPAANVSRVPVSTTGTSDTAQARVEWREVTIPAGTRLPVILETPVGSDISHPEEPVRAHLARAISVHGQKALAEGSRLSGVVTNATQSAREGPGARRDAVRYAGAGWRGRTIQNPNRGGGSDGAGDQEEGRPRDRRARGGRCDHRRPARREERSACRHGGRRRGRRGRALDARKRDSSCERRRAHAAAVSAAHGEGPRLIQPVVRLTAIRTREILR